MRAKTPLTLLGLAAIAVALLVAIPVIAGEADTQPMNKGHMQHGQMQSGDMQKGTMPKATMMKVYTADSLYTCPMHAEVVSADPTQDCPICGMHLKPMTAEQRKALDSTELVGCPMDPIVMPMAKDQDKCPVCGMKLSPIPVPTKQADKEPVKSSTTHAATEQN
ncbi:MAG: heavy metal-binding domain-containing protein [Candidatus Krumholzibacteriia bacterium]|nr:hypothetical protein [bacterium]MCB9516232.1 hypothetical protein [Candidatus Latescibacterota bacterium]